jgi:hypothetical protein
MNRHEIFGSSSVNLRDRVSGQDHGFNRNEQADRRGQVRQRWAAKVGLAFSSVRSRRKPMAAG